MVTGSNSAGAIYYPFSRCIDESALKQMLLLFDSITFIDPVRDESWRAKLFSDIEIEDGRFRNYQDLSTLMPWLMQEGIVKTVDPTKLNLFGSELTSNAILSDIANPGWVAAASRPGLDGLPFQRNAKTGDPAWNIFLPKIPESVLKELQSDPKLRKHIAYQGDELEAWQLSYAAGSAIGINTHLAAAEELGISPVTDSPLHHRLTMMKLRRSVPDGEAAAFSITNSQIDQVAKDVGMKILDQILPRANLERLSLSDIVEFRKESANLRDSFFNEIKANIRREISELDIGGLVKVEEAIQHKIVHQLREFSSEIATLRNRLWPTLLKSISTPIGLGTAGLGLALSYIVSPEHLLLTSVIAAGTINPLRDGLSWKAKISELQRSAPPSVTYLSSVMRKLG